MSEGTMQLTIVVDDGHEPIHVAVDAARGLAFINQLDLARRNGSSGLLLVPSGDGDDVFCFVTPTRVTRVYAGGVRVVAAEDDPKVGFALG